MGTVRDRPGVAKPCESVMRRRVRGLGGATGKISAIAQFRDTILREAE